MPAPYEANREAKRIAEWLRAMGQGELANDILRGVHWDWNPRERGRLNDNRRGAKNARP